MYNHLTKNKILLKTPPKTLPNDTKPPLLSNLFLYNFHRKPPPFLNPKSLSRLHNTINKRPNPSNIPATKLRIPAQHIPKHLPNNVIFLY